MAAGFHRHRLRCASLGHGDRTEGCKAWRELRRSFGVPIESDFEDDVLDIWDPEGADVGEEEDEDE